MKPVIAFVFASLDGYATDAAGEMSWVIDNLGEDASRLVRDQLDAANVLVLGRVTYEEFASYWPTEIAAGEENADRMNAIAKVVFSRTLTDADVTWQNTRLAGGELADEIAELRRAPGHEINVTGSLDLVRSLVEQRLVDRLRLLTFPVVLGRRGARKVFDGYDQTALELVDATVLDSRVLVHDYEPVADGP